MRKIAISDIHGSPKTFKALLTQINFTIEDELYLLGDYIDRGNDSKGVIDYIWQLQAEGYHVKCLKGNHELMLVDAINIPHERHYYDELTYQSFGKTKLEDIPQNYLKWMDELPYYFEVDEYILVHAGLNFVEENPLADTASMLWERRWYTRMKTEAGRKWLGDRIVVHGHTPIPKSIIEFSLSNLKDCPAINIDNGCAYSKPNMSNLCAFDLTNKVFHFHSNIDNNIL